MPEIPRHFAGRELDNFRNRDRLRPAATGRDGGMAIVSSWGRWRGVRASAGRDGTFVSKSRPDVPPKWALEKKQFFD